MGVPALRWQAVDGSLGLAYPRGPAGYHTYLAEFGPDGRLRSLVNVLGLGNSPASSPVRPRTRCCAWIGPPYPGWTEYFERRDELVWEWRYCDDWGRRPALPCSLTATAAGCGRPRARPSARRCLRHGRPAQLVQPLRPAVERPNCGLRTHVLANRDARTVLEHARRSRLPIGLKANGCRPPPAVDWRGSGGWPEPPGSPGRSACGRVRRRVPGLSLDGQDVGGGQR